LGAAKALALVQTEKITAREIEEGGKRVEERKG
jgi:hypothetical protein